MSDKRISGFGLHCTWTPVTKSFVFCVFYWTNTFQWQFCIHKKIGLILPCCLSTFIVIIALSLRIVQFWVYQYTYILHNSHHRTSQSAKLYDDVQNLHLLVTQWSWWSGPERCLPSWQHAWQPKLIQQHNRTMATELRNGAVQPLGVLRTVACMVPTAANGNNNKIVTISKQP